MPRKKNATSFKPGQSGNPLGRPKSEICLTAILRKWLSRDDNAEKVIETLGKAAIDGDIKAIQLMYNRIDGIQQPIEQAPILNLESVARAIRDAGDRYDAENASGPNGEMQR